MNSSIQPGKIAERLNQSALGFSNRPMLRLESSSGLGGRLPVLLAILGMAWAEAQQPQLQEEQTPMPGGKGLCVRQEVEGL